MKVTDAIKDYFGKDAIEFLNEAGTESRPLTYRNAMIRSLGNMDKDESYEVKRRAHRLCDTIADNEEPKFMAEDIVEIKKRVNKTYPSPLVVCRIADFLEPPELK